MLRASILEPWSRLRAVKLPSFPKPSFAASRIFLANQAALSANMARDLLIAMGSRSGNGPHQLLLRSSQYKLLLTVILQTCPQLLRYNPLVHLTSSIHF